MIMVIISGLLPGRALATTCLVNAKHLMDIPDSWTMQEASTVPVVYCTAYYALHIRGQIKSHDSVLIHSGTGLLLWLFSRIFLLRPVIITYWTVI